MAVAAAFCSAPLSVWAASLGPLTVQSGLGQALRAEVAITALGETDPVSLSVGLASPEAFRRAGLEFNPALSSLRFAIEPRGDGGALVRVTSTQPVNEPFVDLMLELSWDSGKFVREYTFLLDPPELRLGQDTVVSGGTGQTIALASAAVSADAGAGSEPAASPAASVAPIDDGLTGTATSAVVAAVPSGSPTLVTQEEQERPASPATTNAQPVSVAQAETSAVSEVRAATAEAPVPVQAPAARADTVRVEAGDTASSIAARFKPADVTLEQAVIALYQANPDAFFGSVHQLFSGKELSIPTDEAIRAVDPIEARHEIRTQVAAFDAWRSRLAASVPTVDAVTAGQSAAGAVSSPAPESAALGDTGDRLELSRPDAVASGSEMAAGAAAASSEESQLAHEAALQEERERVALLERNVSDLQQLLELKNRQLAELQQQFEAVGGTGMAVSGTIDADVTDGADPALAGPDESSAVAAESTAPDAGAALVSSDLAEAVAPAADGEASTSVPMGSDLAAEAESSADETAPVPSIDETAGQASGVADGGVSETGTSTEAGGWLQRLTGHPWAWPALLIIALGLGLVGLLARQRRRHAAEFEDSFTDVDAFATNSLFGTTGGQSIDTHASVFAPGAGGQVATGLITEVDPVAEADVYIAYGREAQAEEILREALQNQPERQAIRLKLLEMHAARRDVEAFSALASEMHEQTGGTNEEWSRVVALGRDIDPDNPLYGYPGDSSPAFPAASDVLADTAAGVSSEVLPDDGFSDTASADVTGTDVLAGEPDALESRLPTEKGAAGSTVPAAMDAGATATTSSEAPVADDDHALDFDFDLGPEAETTVGRIGLQKTEYGPDETQGATPDHATTSSALEQAIGGAFELPTLDLVDDAEAVPTADAGFETGERQTSGEEEPAQADEAPRAQLDDALDFDIDLPSFGELDVRDSHMERPAVDLAELDDSELTGETDAFGLQTVEFDLSGVGDEFAAPGSADEPESARPRWQEMDTKLDLAAAYEEIGDKEGARELLQEVLEGGDSSQQDKARSMLATIG